MGIPVLLIGKSGSGKSTSLRNFASDELYLINVSKKPLPFKGAFDSTLKTDNYATIGTALDKSQKKSIAIDDAGYLITNQFMNGHSSAGAGNGVFALYNAIGDHFWNLVEHIKTLPDDKIVYVIMHEERNDFGDIKPKTIGKLLDEKVCLEGMFTIVLRCVNDKASHTFRTQSDGSDVCKSPIDMFETNEIENDLKIVDQTIRSYYGIEIPTTTKKDEVKK